MNRIKKNGVRKIISCILCILLVLSTGIISVAAEGYPEITNFRTDAEKFNPKAVMLKISYTVNGSGYINCVVFDSKENVVRNLATNSNVPNAGNYYMKWNGADNNNYYVPNGTYTIAIMYTDSEGNQSETLSAAVNVERPASTSNGPVITNIKSNLSIMNAKTDVLKISYTADKACKIYCKLYDLNNNLVTTMINGGKISNSGNWTSSWKGKDGNGNPVTDGSYTVKLYLSNESGNSKTYTIPLKISSNSTSSNSNSKTIVRIPDEDLQRFIRSALEKPDGDLYASDLQKLTKLDIFYRGVKDLTGIEYCTNLTYLTIDGSDGNKLRSIDKLKNLKKLKELRLNFNSLTSVEALRGLTNLRTLEIGGNQISNLEPLSGLKNLEALYLGVLFIDGGNDVKDLSPISGLTNLKYLGLYDNNEITDLSPIKGMTKLVYLYARGPHISSLEPLRNLKNLQDLSIGTSASKISDLGVLSGLTELRKLDLAYNRITKIEALRNLTKLEELSIAGNGISNIEPLSGLYNLKKLALGTQCAGGNPIKVFTPLRNLQDLEELELADMGLKEVGFISNCPNLKFLDLRFNEITNVAPIANLNYLKTLYLDKNPVSDYSPLNNILPNLERKDF